MQSAKLQLKILNGILATKKQRHKKNQATENAEKKIQPRRTRRARRILDEIKPVRYEIISRIEQD